MAGEPRLPRVLSAAMALQFAVGGAVIPFVTLLLRDRGLDFSHISQIFLASSGSLLLFPFLWGLLADRYLPLNRLFTMLNLFACAALVLFATQRPFDGVLVAFALFIGCLNPMFSLINALSFHHLANPREQFGLLRAWGSLGWIVPFLPISLWLLWTNQTRLDFVLYLGIGLSFLMAALSLRLPHTPPGARGKRLGGVTSGVYLPAMKRLLRDPNYLVALASMFLVAGSYSIMMYYSPPLLEDMGVPRLWIGPVQSIGVLSEIALFQWQPMLIRRWNYTTILLIGCLALLCRQIIYSTVDSPCILSLSYPLAGMVIVFYHMVLSVFVNAIAGPEVRATAQTLLVFFGSGLGPMFANWAAGRLAAHFNNSLRPIFLFAAALAALATLLIAIRGRRLVEPLGSEVESLNR